MSQPVPNSYLRAVARTWPFWSPSAHRHRVRCLARRAPGVLVGSTRALADELVEWLQPRCRGLSIDALRAITEEAFFMPGQDSASLGHAIVAIAASSLCRAGGRVTIHGDGAYSSRLEEIRWLTLLLPIDLLIAALYAVESTGDPPTDRLSLADEPLRVCLARRPAAETHLHVGAAFSFGTLWTGVVGRTVVDPSLLGKLPHDLCHTWGDRASFAVMLAAASVGRLMLGAFLCDRELRGDGGPFEAWLPPHLEGLTARLGGGAANRVMAGVHAALTALVLGPQPNVSPARLSWLLRALSGPRPRDPSTLAELAALDPLSSWLGESTEPWPECRFASRALRYLSNSEDAAFEELFWQYQRVRNQLFRLLVQEPGTSGLDWFQRHYERLSPFRAPLRRLRFESALHLEGKDILLGALEARTSFPSAASEVVEDARALRRASEAWAAKSGTRTEVGLIFHFLKERGRGTGKGYRLHADPRQHVHGCRFGAWAYRALREAMAVERAFEQRPDLLFSVRGMDVASSELAIPTWATLPALHRLRRASQRAADELVRRNPGLPAEAMRVTYHVGEEYTHLAEGLRRVHELIETGAVHAGDRLGHAICLGAEVARWRHRHPIVIQPREERVDDLLWELDRCMCGDIAVDASRMGAVRDEIAVHAKVIFERRVDVDELRAARRLRHDVGCLARLGFPFVRASQQVPDLVARCVHEHLTDAGQYIRGKEPVRVDVSELEASTLIAAQAWLRERVAALGMTVESNPSSNILIADFPSMLEHPSLRLAPLDTGASAMRLLLSINADDPVTFATCLSDEMAYFYGALLRAGVKSAAALQWVAERRDQGFDSRFTLPRPGGT